MSVALTRVPPLLVGDDPARTKRWGAVAAGLFVLVLAIFVSGAYRPVYDLLPGRVVVYGAASVLVLLAAVQYYRNRGLLVSLLLCVAPVTALFLLIIGEGQTGEPTLVDTVVLGVGWGHFFGLPLGALGALLGYGFGTIASPNVAR